MLETLERHLLDTLSLQPTISEYDLLKMLRQQQCEGFSELEFSDSLSLFRSHFLLHHVLYRLQTQLWQQKAAYLEITPLSICLHPYLSNQAGLVEPDALRNYYLDWKNLSAMTGQALEDLLSQFWQKFYAAEQKAEALAVFSLQEPTDYATIRQRYRQLAGQHHPDRGGDTQTLQTINHAMTILSRYYRGFYAPDHEA
ncbi:DNA-J related domain-containing protein [Thioflexithrix psekupsensis]|uniref:J domain-containing protein n=1 Tax=Thioflexithrix psekupsensis TaxID=1570016 RepID=A0A251X7L1_9GAMM|nr:DNA-J related domain-containing protein [Thioflexithrix psekupsensis]OUD13971.1 hypothetical protein TPSD3_06400 [Thioflexithrix psekupsensis]